LPHASGASRLVVLLALLLCTVTIARGQSCPSLVPLAIQPPTGQAFQAGCAHVYVIKEAPPTGTNAGYGGLDFSQISPPCTEDQCASLGSGLSRYRCEVANGWPCCVDSLQCLPAELGNMSGPTMQAIQARFAADTDQRENVCYSDYGGNGSRVVITPLTGPKQGSGCYIVYGLGIFFIQKIPGNGNLNFITAEYLGNQAMEGGGLTPAPGSSIGQLKAKYAK
jgi:hypothetical protein